jgi:hypothetical protein
MLCVRFRIWQIMAVVAVVAVVVSVRIETARFRLRRLDYQLRSINHTIGAARYDGTRVVSCRGPYEPASSVYNPGKAAYHAAMARKWADAARYPWLPAETDPPEPK